jgi:imidazole glycerol-phosphate synthase subunit HisH
MSRNVTIIDYGVGNMFSVQRAFEVIDAKAELTSDVDKIMKAERLVLPGVGAFADGMDKLIERNLVEPIREYAKTGKPLLGICLGLQMFFDSSEEFGATEGIGLIPGKVVRLPSTNPKGEKIKIPHIGWSRLILTQPVKGTLLQEIEQNPPAVYFVHSYHVQPNDPKKLLAVCDFNGVKVSAVAQSENIMGCQFHPEKSADAGLRILRQFISL